jgi:hypothetical protein
MEIAIALPVPLDSPVITTSDELLRNQNRQIIKSGIVIVIGGGTFP